VKRLTTAEAAEHLGVAQVTRHSEATAAEANVRLDRLAAMVERLT
jgi:hypothetical protein